MDEGEGAAKRKVEIINSGAAPVTDFISIDDLSPNWAY